VAAKDAAAADTSKQQPPQQQHDSEPAAKKLKTGGARAAAAANGVIRGSLLAPESRSRLRADLEAAQPYTHLVLQELCDPAVLRAVRSEVINNISATYKETDLFKVFQTGVRACVVARKAHCAAGGAQGQPAFARNWRPRLAQLR
jgi:hypothetical protein